MGPSGEEAGLIPPSKCMDELAEDQAWVWLENSGWVPTPELLFAMKALIREQMLGG